MLLTIQELSKAQCNNTDSNYLDLSDTDPFFPSGFCGNEVDGTDEFTRYYKTDIPRSVRAEEISAEGASIFKHDPKGKVADAYRVLTKEVLKNAEKRRKHQLEGLR